MRNIRPLHCNTKVHLLNSIWVEDQRISSRLCRTLTMPSRMLFNGPPRLKLVKSLKLNKGRSFIDLDRLFGQPILGKKVLQLVQTEAERRTIVFIKQFE